MLYLSVATDHENQLKIIQALTRKFKLHPDLDLRAVANACPLLLTGADFYALCSDALLKAMSRTAAAVDEKIGEATATLEISRRRC
jgi:peroxin-6